jgi:hypothetical protein
MLPRIFHLISNACIKWNLNAVEKNLVSCSSSIQRCHCTCFLILQYSCKSAKGIVSIVWCSHECKCLVLAIKTDEIHPKEGDLRLHRMYVLQICSLSNSLCYMKWSFVYFLVKITEGPSGRKTIIIYSIWWTYVKFSEPVNILSGLCKHMLWICSLSEVKVLDSRNLLTWYWGSIQQFTEIIQTAGEPGYNDISLCKTKYMA